MFSLSQRSQDRLIGVDLNLVKVVNLAIKTTPIDFGIPEYGGVRTAGEQNGLFIDGKSKCDGYIKISNHQIPEEEEEEFGKAVDVYAYIHGHASWDKIHLALVAGAILAAANKLNVPIRWGGTFGSKGKDFKGWDYPHFELVLE